MIIGLSGLAGSGKDTVADILTKHDGFVKVSLADPLKRLAQDLWDFSFEQLWGASENRSKPDLRYPIKINDEIEYLTPRKVLQHLGTEGARALDKDVWVRYSIKTARKLLFDKAFPGAKETCWAYSNELGLVDRTENTCQGEFERIEGFTKKVKAVIIPDVRFVNEFKFIKQAGGIFIRITRPGAGLKGSFATHSSESEQSSIPDSEFDHIIYNSGTLEELETKTNSLVKQLLNI